MSLYIHKTIFGIKGAKEDYFSFGKSNENNVYLNTEKDVAKLCESYSIEQPLFPSEKWRKIAKALNIQNPIWQLLLPEEEHKKEMVEYVKTLISSIKENTIDKLYYYSNVVPYEEHLLKSFRSVCYSDDTEVSAYKYRRTSVGRFISENNTNLFHMSQQRREQILTSRFPGGKIISIDFRALEPRVMLIISNPDFIDGCEDVYAKIADECSSDVSREVIKLSLLKILNGASNHVVQSGTELSNNEIDSLRKNIHYIFGYSKTLEKLVAEQNEKGRAFNYFGRPLVVKDYNDNHPLLYTYNMQSTSADVCAIVFSKIIKVIEKQTNLSKIVPVAMIYDSMVFDVAPGQEQILDNAVKAGSKMKFDGKQFDFPMTKKIWNEQNAI